MFTTRTWWVIHFSNLYSRYERLHFVSAFPCMLGMITGRNTTLKIPILVKVYVFIVDSMSPHNFFSALNLQYDNLRQIGISNTNCYSTVCAVIILSRGSCLKIIADMEILLNTALSALFMQFYVAKSLLSLLTNAVLYKLARKDPIVRRVL